jgi:hypothetical protein
LGSSKKAALFFMKMTHSPSTTDLGQAYNDFLFAPVSEDAEAAPLNTVSVLARLGIDPWREAAELAGMPKAPAIARLAALLVRMPGDQDQLPDAQATAKRLVALLPTRKSRRTPVVARIIKKIQALRPPA